MAGIKDRLANLRFQLPLPGCPAALASSSPPPSLHCSTTLSTEVSRLTSSSVTQTVQFAIAIAHTAICFFISHGAFLNTNSERASELESRGRQRNAGAPRRATAAFELDEIAGK